MIYNPQMPKVIADLADHHRREACQLIKKSTSASMHMYYEGQRVAYEHMNRLIVDAFHLNNEQTREQEKEK